MSSPTLWAVIPVKRLRHAKQRLAPVLAGHERAGLARAMFEDVLGVLSSCPFLAGTVVVTSDDEAAEIARGAGTQVLADPAEPGLSAALRHAARTLAAARCGGMLVVPADLPQITSDDIRLIALGHRHAPAVTLIAASNDGGTNALACSPPDAMPLLFGDDSFRRHCEAATALGLAPRQLTLPRFARDIDRPLDLLACLRGPAGPRTHRYLGASGIARRLREAHAHPIPILHTEPAR